MYGVGTPGPSGVDVRFSGLLHFPSGLVAQFAAGFTSEHHTLEAIGSAGSVRLTNPWQSRPVSIISHGVETPIEAENFYRLELENVGRAIRGEGAPLLGRDDALGQARALDALGSTTTSLNSIGGLRKRGRHVQVGLMVAGDARPAIPMDLVISRELEIRGSHGMAAHDYGAMLARISDGSLRPGRLVGRTIGLDEAPAALAAMDQPSAVAGMTVILPAMR